MLSIGKHEKLEEQEEFVKKKIIKHFWDNIPLTDEIKLNS